ncbi:MAG TPA: hypothetical protein VHY31_04310 [Streptosporangiaceae bacterium]|nr:hypothetical protein [Streptosporangiaceae bacterium]
MLAETQNSRQSFVDTPLLIRGDPPHKGVKLSGVDGADLLDQNAGGLAPQQFYLSGRDDAGMALSDVGVQDH